MTSKYDTYTSPLAERNASPEMLRLWSARHKFNTWRWIWLAVAEAQRQCGLPVTDDQIRELRANLAVTDADIELANQYEREFRHDVMAHIHAWGDRCPQARGIIHLGMTSQDVVCNADAIILSEAIDLIRHKTAFAVSCLAETASRFAALPCLGFTHFQPAQPVTVGRRMIQWASDLELCFRRLSPKILLRGLRGATGTQASFETLIRECNASPWVKLYSKLVPGADLRDLASFQVCQVLRGADALEYEFGRALDEDEWPVKGPDGMYYSDYGSYGLKIDQNRPTSQTYPRVIDCFILSDLAAVAAVLHKIATDIRLLCNRKELDEPFEDKQIGSSAMPYKRNPMRCERICGLTRFVMNLVGNAYDTAATQWLERTLDDSSNRRLSLPEAFLALDGALDLMHNVASGLIVHEAMVRKNLMAELPFMATENILMECVKLGGDRQEFHEIIRAHAQTAGLRVKDEGLDNDLIDRLKNDKAFWPASRGGTHGLRGELNWGDADSSTGGTSGGLLDPMKYIGRSIEQTERFIKEVVEPLREQYGEAIEKLGQSGPRV